MPQGNYGGERGWEPHPRTEAAGWRAQQSRGYERRPLPAPATPEQFRAPGRYRDGDRRSPAPAGYDAPRFDAQWRQPQFQPQAPAYAQPQQRYAPQPRPSGKTSLTAAEQFWYILMCVGMGAGYFAKIPAKKALSDFGLAEMTAAEKFWYVLMCLPMGAAYFCKVPVAKAITEMQHR